MTVTLQELVDASRVIREAALDRTLYERTAIGSHVTRYLQWKTIEGGARPRTVGDYEYILAALCLHFPDWPIERFGTSDAHLAVREFWYERWGHSEARTRGKSHTVLNDFFKWCDFEGYIQANPMRKIRRPKLAHVERTVFHPDTARLVFDANPRSREQAALGCLFGLGLRRGELRMLQLGRYDQHRAQLRIARGAKGGKIRTLPISDPWLRQLLDDHWAQRKLSDGWPDEYLLYPEHIGQTLDGLRVTWEDRHAPLSDSGIHAWWARCLHLAGLDPRGENSMHHARHTAITDVLRATGNIKLAQMMAGHASISTTADIYGHLDIGDLAEGLALRAAKRDGNG